MTWKVQSGRLAWPAGTVVGVSDLAGCNIDALVQGSHLAPVENKRSPAEQVMDNPILEKSPAKPVETANEPKES